MRKKPRLSIIVQIAIVFLIAMHLSIGLIPFFGKYYLMKRAVAVNQDTAEGVANLVRYYIEPRLPMSSLSEEHLNQTRELFRELCINFHFRYVYLYAPVEDGIMYYIAAAEDDHMHEEILKIRPYGTVVKRAPYQAETDILAGEKDCGYQFVTNQFGRVCMFIFPVKDKDGNVVAFIGIDDDLSDVQLELAKEQQMLMLAVLVYFIIAHILSLVLLRRVVIHPIDSLSKKMRSFIEDKNTELPKRSYIFTDEVTDIQDSFEKMAGDISAYVKDIEEYSMEKAKDAAQIDVARKIQSDIVAPDFNIIGNGYNAFCVERPARAVGGDFYDIFSLNDKEICVIVGDISGKGISAALFMVMVKTNLRNYVNSGASMAEVLKHVNGEICRTNSQDMFATVFLSVLNTETGVLRYANAGHEKPLFLCENPYYLEPDSGMALGLFDDATFVDEECTLKDNQGILIYTDGIVESINTEKKQYGMKLLKENVKNLCAHSAEKYESEKVVRFVIDSVDDYSKDMEQFDDITCVALIYRDNEKERLLLKPELSSFDIVKEKMIAFLGNTEESRNKIMACEEMFSNIVNYSGTDTINVIFRLKYNVFAVELIDHGVPFDPINAVIRNKDFLELDTGGMGIKLARLNTKEMIYSRTEDSNRLLMKYDLPKKDIRKNDIPK